MTQRSRTAEAGELGPRPAIVFRADASHRIGLGHVARITALVDALAELGPHGAEPILMLDGDAAVASWLSQRGIMATTDLATGAAAMSTRPPPANENRRSSSPLLAALSTGPAGTALHSAAFAEALAAPTAMMPAPHANDEDAHAPILLRPWTAQDVLAAATSPNVRAVVIDGPALARALVPALAMRGIRTVVLDDLGDCDLPLDLVINHNHHAPALAGTYPNARRQLLGRSYLMLRRSIRALGRGACLAHRSLAQATRARLRVVITYGGSDPIGATARTLAALAALPTPALEVVAIAGPGFRDRDALHAAARRASAAGHSVEIAEAPDEPGTLFATADAAICSAGGTLGELAFLGCPALAFAIVPDQIATARSQAEDHLIAGGGALPAMTDDELGGELRRFLADDARRAHLAQRALATTDGLGPRRILTDILG